MFDQLASSILLWLALISGSNNIPDTSAEWDIVSKWNLDVDHPTLEIKSEKILDLCGDSKDKFLELPLLLYGAYDVEINGNVFKNFGDKTFNKANYIINYPYIRCSDIPNQGEMVIKIYAYTPSYARILTWPKISSSVWMRDFFSKYLYIAGASGLVLLSILSFFIMYRRENNKLTLSICASAIFMSIYQIGVISPIFGISLSSFRVNQISDISLNWGIFLIMRSLYIESAIPKWLYNTHKTFSIISFIIHVFANSGDMVQIGTSLYFPIGISCLTVAFIHLSKKFYIERSIDSGMKLIFSILFLYIMFSEMLLFSGVLEIYSVLSIGVISGYLVFVFAVNQRISKIYKERDDLRENLEIQVEKKTEELLKKNVALEKTMTELKFAQAELVQSAKLASLGTLSAGIAHEINNSINFVSGAILPLEKIVLSILKEEKERSKIISLLNVAKDGLKITVEIIQALKHYSGVNHAKMKNIKISEIVNTSLTILNSKIKGKITVYTDLPQNLEVYGNTVGLNQVFMNIIANAIDSIEKNGEVRIVAREIEKYIYIEISDTGAGIPSSVIDKIFDPFYTTKDVGKGTGLGLYIVKKEIDNHHGEIKVSSIIKKGTTFTIKLPINEVQA